MTVQAHIERHAHLVEQLRIYCRSAYLVEYIDRLLITDSNRQGFSFETLSELSFLRELYIRHWERLKGPFALAEQDAIIREARRQQLHYEYHGKAGGWR